MRKINKILFLLFLVPASLVFADAFDDYLVDLEKYKNEIAANFFNVIQSQYRYSINRHFSFAAMDHVATSVGLVMYSDKESQRVREIRDRFEMLQRQVSENPTMVDAVAAEMFSLFGEIKQLQARSDIYKKDLEIVARSWENYCNDDRLKQLDRFFNPLAKFIPDQSVGYLATPNIPFSISIGISMNQSGEVTGVNDGTQPEQNQQLSVEETAWGVSVGLAAYYCSPGGPVASVACGLAVVVFKVLIDGGHEAAKLAKKKDKQNDLLQEIYDIQIGAIQRLATISEHETQQLCRDNFAADQSWPSSRLEEYQRVTANQAQIMETFLDEDLKTLQGEQYDYLIHTYLPEVLKNYVSNIKSYFNNKVVLNQQVVQFTQEQVIPKMELIKQSSVALNKAFAEQSLWNQVILGDALYRESEGFSFQETTPVKNTFPNRWEEISRQIFKEVMP